MSENLELKISDESKEKLRCVKCGGYLMCSPIRILPNGNNLCGRCSADNTIITYRNLVLEEILKDAIFPCKFKHKGCMRRLAFISDSDHESTCQYNSAPSTSEETTKNAVGNTSSNVVTSAIKTSDSVCEQDISASTNKDQTVFLTPKAGNAVNGNTSVCTDTTPGPSWQQNSNRPESTSSSRPQSVNFNSRNRRSSSVVSNRTRQWNYQRPSPWNRPYNTDWRHIQNRNQWQSPWECYGHGEHINMYKRRNNLIIIKGGTFYVNW